MHEQNDLSKRCVKIHLERSMYINGYVKSYWSKLLTAGKINFAKLPALVYLKQVLNVVFVIFVPPKYYFFRNNFKNF